VKKAARSSSKKSICGMPRGLRWPDRTSTGYSAVSGTPLAVAAPAALPIIAEALLISTQHATARLSLSLSLPLSQSPRLGQTIVEFARSFYRLH
jgi:hypothetical protein